MTRSVLHLFGLAASLMLVTGCRAEPQLPQNPPIETAETVETAPAAAQAETIAVTIRTDAGEHLFDAELAITPEEQRRGLMFRESLPENGGMLFPFEYPRYASFWMRNTVIPLDMIFVMPDGRISNIARETVPYTLDSHMSDDQVIAVLEIAGGRAEELGIGRGDQVSWEGGPALPQ
ncbi:DUF192 domain-containing protein [Parasphingopyxis marina]|uniref:DUF192 domain-containing protein n=1 Tax=Parasphingopyxis marina TaxID=2761622 RepID=A0A842HZ55_9SPHN|nr:DUF192 domain-containing protein [Parasphingopyxis marina]MBC2777220.1 DUF192 domain-containing protein [Parasphingopyxis marina]